ncbi:MAG: PD-(D/E)XK nuclease family protein [Thermoguttaceae bacterium]|nr:PD-(D/E)XK nuclease family protein [Thermoguttaceae bacterium]
MSIRRFFDWSKPFIPTVARFVVQNELLGATAQAPKELDLGRFVFVTAGKRALRALESYVQNEAEQAIAAGLARPDWTPPQYFGIGAIPEELYPRRAPIAERLEKLYAQRRALETFLERDSRAKLLVPTSFDANEKDDAVIQLAQTFLSLDQQLADERRSYADVARACQERDAPEEAERWRALESLHALYVEELKKLGFVDKNDARENALSQRAVGGTAFDSYNDAPRLYRVLGAVDLKRQQLDFFKAIDDRVEYWVCAPETEADSFDEFGRVLPDAWQDFRANILDENVFQVDSPVEQGEAVALLIKELSKAREEDGSWRYERIDPDQVTIGLPDDDVAPFVEEQMAALDYDVDLAEGDKASQNRVFRLLSNVVDYLETRSFEALGELMRRADVEAYLERKWRFAPRVEDEPDEARSKSEETRLEALEREIREQEEAEREDAIEDEIVESYDSTTNATPQYRGAWLKEYDEYRARFLPTFVPEKWLVYEDPDSEKRNAKYYDLRKATRIIDDALADFRNDELGRLSRQANDDATKFNAQDVENAKKLARANNSNFNRDEFGEKFRVVTNLRRRPVREWAPILSKFICEIYASEDAAPRSRAADAQINGFVAEFNKQLNSLDAIKSDENLTGATAIRMILKQLASERIPPLPGSKRVEIQGWLDLLFDDAPYLILTGFNEGSVPTSRADSLFLPNETLRMLGMRDARQNLARDAYLTRAVASSKRAFFVTLGRRSLDEDPLMPSRFLFAVEPDDVPKRAVRFFSQTEGDDLERLRALQENRDFPRRNRRQNDSDELEFPTTGDPDIDAINRKSAAFAQENERRMNAQKERKITPPTLILPPKSAPTIMKVTEFENFLQSPYRYFLSYVYNLRPVPTTNVGELNPADFGTLVHDVLRAFGQDPEINNSTNFNAINAWLSKRLDDRVEKTFNEHASPFVFVQVENIRARLRVFAQWQAQWRALGNEIRYVETAPSNGGVVLDIGVGAPVLVVGRIDRIDYSKEKKRWYVFDYKTYDSPKKGTGTKDESETAPETKAKLFSLRNNNEVDKRHREPISPPLDKPAEFCRRYGLNIVGAAAEKAARYRWINLQLPLYRLLAQKLLRERDVWNQDDEITLGYLCVGNTETYACGARWHDDDLQYAEETARWVVREIRRIWAAGKIEPGAAFIPEWNLGKALPRFQGRFNDDFAPITLSGIGN